MKGLIYMYTNIVNGKQYIGQTRLTPQKRAGHNMRFYLNKNQNKFANAIRKWGYDKFVLTIIHDNIDIELLNDYEMLYIEMYSTFELGYNSTTGGNQKSIISEETRKKQSISKKGIYDGVNNPMFGRHHNDDTKKKISDKNKGRNVGPDNGFYGHHHTDETKKILSSKNKGKSHNFKHSDETKALLSNSNKGENNPFYGHHHTEEVKAKIAEASSNRTHSDETKAKISMKARSSRKCEYDSIIFASIKAAYDYAKKNGYTKCKSVFKKELIFVK